METITLIFLAVMILAYLIGAIVGLISIFIFLSNKYFSDIFKTIIHFIFISATTGFLLTPALAMHVSYSATDRIIFCTLWAINTYLIILFIKARTKVFDSISKSKSATITVKEKTHDEIDSLISATINNDINSVIEILNSGANPRTKDSSGYTAIDYARGHGYNAIQELLEKNITNRPT